MSFASDVRTIAPILAIVYLTHAPDKPDSQSRQADILVTSEMIKAGMWELISGCAPCDSVSSISEAQLCAVYTAMRSEEKE